MISTQRSSTPSIENFNPMDVAWQTNVIYDVRHEFDYGDGFHEILLSGSVGSAKSLLMAHIVATHCLMYPGARACLGRRALPDLKATIFQKIKEHISPTLREGIDYKCNDSTAYIGFSNGSEIISRSWADRSFTKVRSLELSLLAIEELTEDDTNEAYEELSMRVNRLPHVPEQLIICATNPDSPSHWAHKYFIQNPSPTRHVYYSVTSDNKFLPASYIKKLKEDLDPKMVERMIYGKWIDIAGETIYYQYDPNIHYKDHAYKINKQYPVHFSWDFNIAEGKPMSVVFFQYIDDCFHFFDEATIEGLRTEAMCVELEGRGMFKLDTPFYYLHGDSTGSNRDTKSNFNNYEIIAQFLDKNKITYKYAVIQNPPIKTRHNLMNGYLKNAEGRVRFYLYGKSEKKCKMASEGLLLTKLKTGSQYIEDDSKAYQHITTAIGYGVYYCHQAIKSEKSKSIQL